MIPKAAHAIGRLLEMAFYVSVSFSLPRQGFLAVRLYCLILRIKEVICGILPAGYIVCRPNIVISAIEPM